MVGEKSDAPIRGPHGDLDVTIAEYDSKRCIPLPEGLQNRAFCYGPLVNMDFNPYGNVRPCNHFANEDFATLMDGQSILEVWNSAPYRELRESMRRYELPPECRHCEHQLPTKAYSQVFAGIDFDAFASEDAEPTQPRRLSLQLSNICNLSCVMCFGEASCIIRKERDKLPPLGRNYGEAFFEQLEQIIPGIEEITLYGGEPLIMHEYHVVFDMLKRLNPECQIRVTTNATVVNESTKKFFEDLNFVNIAISMDAHDPELLSEVRTGLKYDKFKAGFEWLVSLARRRDFYVGLNVTEHRKNWFDLPELFRFAERRALPVHITHCIYPKNLSLYTLSTAELEYVLGFFRRERARIDRDFPEFMNASRYDYFMSLSETELARRGADWAPDIDVINPESDGLLAAPRPGITPFDRPERVREEIPLIRALGPETGGRMLAEMAERAEALPDQLAWGAVVEELRA